MRALVLSGGGLFGAWQAGAWRVLSEHWQPDLIVGASVGSLNGYVIASGAPPEELLAIWRETEFRNFRRLHENLRRMTSHYQVRRPLAVAVTETFRLKPRLYRDQAVTWQVLAASCAVPFALPQVRLDGTWMTDGGLLGALPVWAARELGATQIAGLHVLREFPSPVLAPFARAFQATVGRWRGAGLVDPSGTSGVAVLAPSERLGGLRETLWGSAADVERWIALGEKDARRWLEGSHLDDLSPLQGI